MKNKLITINTKLLLAASFAAVTFLSCSKWDEFKKYTAGGEIIYSGKLDSVKALSGKNRVRINGFLNADPKITTIRIFWNNKNDSIVYDTKTTAANKLFSQTFAVPEGIANFIIFTYDADGNKSVPVYVGATIYGDRYQSSLQNRLISNAEVQSNGAARIDWADVSANAGVVGMEVLYADTAGVNHDTTIVSTSPTGLSSQLPRYQVGSRFQYRTLFQPTPTAIDTFYTAYVTMGAKADVTARYLQNTAVPFASAANSTDPRWRRIATWTTTPDVENMAGGGFGSVDAAGWLPGPSMSMEAGWGAATIPNGKIYQTITLPAGKYMFEASTGDASSGGTKYITVVKGIVFPDISQTPSQALKYINLSRFTANQLSFELTDPTTVVSIGFQGSLPGTTPGNFFKVFKIKLFSMP